MSDLNNNINSIRNSLKDIRTAVNSKGANIQEGDDLNTWDEKIGAMPDVHVYGPDHSVNLFPSYIRLVDKLTVPIEDPDGNGYPVAIAPSQTLLASASEIVIPEHFTSCNFTNSAMYYNKYAMNKVRYEGASVSNLRYLLLNPQLEEIDLPNATTVGGLYYVGDASAAAVTPYRKVTINIDNYTGSIFQGSGASYNVEREIEINAPKVETISSLGSSTGSAFYGTYGKINLPGLKTLICGSQLIYGTGTNKTQRWDLSSLTSFTTSTSSNYPWYSPNGGHVDLYIGKDLATFTISNATTLTNFKTAITNGIVTIHIPSGDSTTKDTLDTAGIEYEPDND